MHTKPQKTKIQKNNIEAKRKGVVAPDVAPQVLILDVDTGEIIQSSNAQKVMYPSSMTKILTTLYALELVKCGKLSLDEIVTVPAAAYKTEGTSMFLELGQRLTVRELLDGIAAVSGNDACRVLAIHVSGDERTFASAMSAFAKKIGAKHTHFVNASGLPDAEQQTTPYDLAVVALYLMNHYKNEVDRFSAQEFTFNGIHQYNKNVILRCSTPTFVCDGLKTGYTEKAGYGIVLTAYNPKTSRRILCVLNGLKSEGHRKQECLRLLEWAFKSTQNKIVHRAGEAITKLPVRYGDVNFVSIGPKKNVGYVCIGSVVPAIKVMTDLPKSIKGPLPVGSKVGYVILTANNKSKKIPLVTLSAIKPANVFKRIWHKVRYR